MSTNTTKAAPRNPPLARLPERMHHHAFIVRDQEENRKFIEDLLGIPLTSTWCEEVFNRQLNAPLNLCHTYYSFADGSALSFFQFANPGAYEQFRPPVLPNLRYDHLAVKVDLETYGEVERRLKAADYPFNETHHGYCMSLYVTSPDDFTMEFAYDAANSPEIFEERAQADPHRELREWLAGNRTPNNHWHQQKIR
ncbi:MULTISPECIES: VOC family protein [unclassified Variovorax]|uniref:VOC family protein n=1 Tax=unclassified Variovorax TaxID=663243 RepID=UPI003ECE0480